MFYWFLQTLDQQLPGIRWIAEAISSRCASQKAYLAPCFPSLFSAKGRAKGKARLR